MKNCLILGFGRSGTSLMGGLLHSAGYYMGNHLHPARDTNPKGFFEDMIINRINEQILESFDYSRFKTDYPVYSKPYSPYFPKRGQRWLSMIEPGTKINCSNETVLEQIKNTISSKQRFAYKDPRFNYTLTVWESLLPKDTQFICMFRNPAAVVGSVIKECKSVDYLKEFYIDEEMGFQIWYNSYRHLIDSLTQEIRKKMLFVSYEDLVNGKYINEISTFLDATLISDFVEPTLNRTQTNIDIPQYVEKLFDELKELSKCNDENPYLPY